MPLPEPLEPLGVGRSSSCGKVMWGPLLEVWGSSVRSAIPQVSAVHDRTSAGLQTLRKSISSHLGHVSRLPSIIVELVEV